MYEPYTENLADVLGTLIIHLNQRTASMRRPIGQTFLLNNRKPSFCQGNEPSLLCWMNALIDHSLTYSEYDCFVQLRHYRPGGRGHVEQGV